MKSLELYKKICKEIGIKYENEDLEDMESVTIENIEYGLVEVEKLETIDNGKYQCGGTIYGVGFLNEEKGYGIKGEILFYIEQDFTQTGSYYSSQEREYENPYVVEKKEVKKFVWKCI